MDPLSALGLAASIVQFLTFSKGVLDGTVELYRSVDGATSVNARLEFITRDLHQLCGKLGAEANGCRGQFKTDPEAGLLPLIKVGVETHQFPTQAQLLDAEREAS